MLPIVPPSDYSLVTFSLSVSRPTIIFMVVLMHHIYNDGLKVVNQSSSCFLIFGKTPHDVWKLYGLMSRSSKATRDGGARGEGMMEIKQRWKGIFFHVANATQFQR